MTAEQWKRTASSTSNASSLAGRQIAEYRFDRRLGAGGMGDVYQARDLKLGRDVAIKVLPEHWHGDHEHHARFAREAGVIASLDELHVGALYGTLESGAVRGLVLELAAGPTLPQVLESRATRNVTPET